MKRIAVLLNNKLITCDTIVPVMIEIKSRAPNVSIEFVCFDAATADTIKANIVLWDLIQSIGVFRVLGRTRRGPWSWLTDRPRTLLHVFRYACLGALGRMSFIHFKALNEWPLRLIAWLAKGHVCYFQNTAAGFADLERKVTSAMVERRYPTTMPAGDLLVSFTQDWLPLNDQRLAAVPRATIPPSFMYATWIDYIRRHAGRYLKDVLSQRGLASDTPVVTFILSSMDTNGLLREPDLFPWLFDETLDALAEAGCTDPILIKPHPAMNAKYRAYIQEAAARRPLLKILFCDLHPAVLAVRSRFVIANCYSTTFSVFSYLGIPRIEYSDYRPDILEITQRGSLRPDLVSHFINGDRVQLATVLRNLLCRTPNGKVAGVRPDFPPALMSCLGLA